MLDSWWPGTHARTSLAGLAKIDELLERPNNQSRGCARFWA